MRSSHRCCSIVLINIKWCAFIQHNDQVGAELSLDLDRLLRCQMMNRSVHIRPERRTVLGDYTDSISITSNNLIGCILMLTSSILSSDLSHDVMFLFPLISAETEPNPIENIY